MGLTRMLAGFGIEAESESESEEEEEEEEEEELITVARDVPVQR